MSGTPTDTGSTADVAQLGKLAAETEQKEKQEPELPGMPATPAPTPEKKKYWSRRKKTEKATPPPGLVLPRELIKSMIQAPYALAARYLGADFALTDQEAEAMVDPHNALAQKYLPETVKNNPELYAVLFLHALAIVSRLQLYLQIRAAQLEQQEREAGGGIPRVKSDRSDPGKAWSGEIVETPGRVTPGA